VTIQELRNTKNKQPFEPFVLQMADGRQFRVTHPDAMAWEPTVHHEETDEIEEPRIVHLIVPGAGWESIDLERVTSLSFPPDQSEDQPKPKRRRRGS
jgi:hypothetical protein